MADELKEELKRLQNPLKHRIIISIYFHEEQIRIKALTIRTSFYCLPSEEKLIYVYMYVFVYLLNDIENHFVQKLLAINN